LYAFTDNSTAAFACEKGTSKKSMRLRQLVRRLRHLDSLLGCQTVVVWISGTRIKDSGADSGSRGVQGDGLMGSRPGPSGRDFQSPLTVPGYFPSTHLLQALQQALPKHRLLLQPSQWLSAPVPTEPVLLVVPNLLGREALRQVKKWDQRLDGRLDAAVLIEDTHGGRTWRRESRRYASELVVVKKGTWGHPQDAEGDANLLLFHGGQPQTKEVAQGVAGESWRPELQLQLAGPNETVLWPTVEARDEPLAREQDSTALNDPSTCPCCPRWWEPCVLQAEVRRPASEDARCKRRARGLPDTVLTSGGRPVSGGRLMLVEDGTFSKRAVQLLDQCAFMWLLRREATAVRAKLRAAEKILRWLRRRRAAELVDGAHGRERLLRLLGAVDEVIELVDQRGSNVTPVRPLGPRLIWWRFPPAEWWKLAVGMRLPLRSEPEAFDLGLDGTRSSNYKSSQGTQEGVEEADRILTAGYAHGPFDADDLENVKLVTPMGGVRKADDDKLRITLDAAVTGLNAATEERQFMYDQYLEMFGTLYPGAYYFKVDWSDAFLGLLVAEEDRKYLAFEHPGERQRQLEQLKQLSPQDRRRLQQRLAVAPPGLSCDAAGLPVDADARARLRAAPGFERLQEHVRRLPKHHYGRLIFGWVLSPYYFTRVAQIVVDRTLRAPEFAGELVLNAERPNCPALLHHRKLPVTYRVAGDGSVAATAKQYMDDGVGVAPSLWHGRRALRRMIAELHYHGAAPKSSKTLQPTTHGGAILGFGADTRGGIRTTIPDARLKRLQRKLEDFTLKFGGQRTGEGEAARQ